MYTVASLSSGHPSTLGDELFVIVRCSGVAGGSPCHHCLGYDIMTIVELFFIYEPFVTIRRVMLVVKGSEFALQSSAVRCSRMVRV